MRQLVREHWLSRLCHRRSSRNRPENHHSNNRKHSTFGLSMSHIYPRNGKNEIYIMPAEGGTRLILQDFFSGARQLTTIAAVEAKSCTIF